MTKKNNVKLASKKKIEAKSENYTANDDVSKSVNGEEGGNIDNESPFVPFLISRRNMKNEQPVHFQIYDTSNTSSLIMEDFNKMMNDCVGTMNSSLNSAIDSVNVRCELVQELMNKTVNSVGESLEKNFTNSQDLIKCTAVSDFVEFQHKCFSTNIAAALNLFMDLSYLTQSYYSKASEVTSKYTSHLLQAGK